MVQIPTEDSTATTKLTIDAADDVVDVRTGLQADALQQAITDHLRYSIGRHASVLTPAHYYRALALALRDRVQQRWIASTQTFLDLSRKVVCYLSAEFLMGPQLGTTY
jgi:glycogen phosphorylase